MQLYWNHQNLSHSHHTFFSHLNIEKFPFILSVSSKVKKPKFLKASRLHGSLWFRLKITLTAFFCSLNTRSKLCGKVVYFAQNMVVQGDTSGFASSPLGRDTPAAPLKATTGKQDYRLSSLLS